MAFTKLEPSSVNTSATFTFANVSTGNILTDNILYANGSPYTFTTAASGSNTQIQYNDNGSFAGSANLTFNKTSNTLSVTNITANGAGITYITGSNVTGAVALATLATSATSATSATTAGTVTTGAQPNITSHGTLTGLTVSGTTNLGAITNVKITGGLTNQVLTTDGLGNLSWTAGGGGGGSSGGAGFITVSKDTFTATGSANTYTISITPTSAAYIVVNIDGIVQQLSSYSLSGNVVTITGMPSAGEVVEITSYGVGGLPGGSDTQVQFNSSGVFQGAPAFTFNSSTSTLSVTNITGNLVTATQANVTSLGTLNGVTVTGNANVANLNVSGTGLYQQSTEVLVAPTFANPLSVAFTSGSTIYVTPTANFTLNVTGVPTTDNRTIVIVVILAQGSTGYYPNVFQIDGTEQTINWSGGTTPTTNANKKDVASFTLIRTGAAWTVLGQYGTFG